MTNKELLLENEKLRKENLALKGMKSKTPEIPTFTFSRIRDKELKKLVNIKKNLDESIFDEWLNNKIDINAETLDFLDNLLTENRKLISTYNEDELKMYFIAPILNKVKFLSYKDEVRGFYETALNYETDKFIFNGNVDFVFAKGLLPLLQKLQSREEQLLQLRNNLLVLLLFLELLLSKDYHLLLLLQNLL